MGLGQFFALLIAGVLSGLVYELGIFLRFVCRGRTVPTVVIDFAVALVSGGLFVLAEWLYADFVIRGAGVAAYFAGIAIERATIGFLLAKCAKSLYNGAVRVWRRVAKVPALRWLFK